MLRELIKITLESISVSDNLKERGVDTSKTRVIVSEEENTAAFLLYNSSGQLVGYQQYRPGASKSQNNDPKAGRYFTFLGDEGKGKKIGVWGLETITPSTQTVYIVEGIFDAIKIANLGKAVLAVFTNNPKHLTNWLYSLSMKIIAILDNDESEVGKKLGRFASESYITPEPYKDLGDMPQSEVSSFIKEIESGQRR